nr:MAG TPA: hypothetical protein [Caudoviricetes sp.]
MYAPGGATEPLSVLVAQRAVLFILFLLSISWGCEDDAPLLLNHSNPLY